MAYHEYVQYIPLYSLRYEPNRHFQLPSHQSHAHMLTQYSLGVDEHILEKQRVRDQINHSSKI